MSDTVIAIASGDLRLSANQQCWRLVGHPEEMDGAIGWLKKNSINAEELAQLRAKRQVSLLDVRERDEFRIWHNESAVNIPFSEFDIRAPFELSDDTLEVVDCSQFSSEACASIVARVRGRGFPAVAFSEGLAFRSCDVAEDGS